MSHGSPFKQQKTPALLVCLLFDCSLCHCCRFFFHCIYFLFFFFSPQRRAAGSPSFFPLSACFFFPPFFFFNSERDSVEDRRSTQGPPSPESTTFFFAPRFVLIIRHHPTCISASLTHSAHQGMPSLYPWNLSEPPPSLAVYAIRSWAPEQLPHFTSSFFPVLQQPRRAEVGGFLRPSLPLARRKRKGGGTRAGEGVSVCARANVVRNGRG